ncbi:MAG: 2OG-Fe(II) oxygenase [Gemmataceae bacterium]|nr:2OG-Fe(II) oxygenase [Gemmataceae bacterium]
MNPKKQKAKDRRRARKLADQAWQAANDNNFDLAEKIILRAVAAQEDNPVLWNDLGVLLGLRQKDDEAADSFRAALSLAPTYAEPYMHLAAQRFRQGAAHEAVALQTLAARYAPEKTEYLERLQAYQAVAGRQPAHAVLAHAVQARPNLEPAHDLDDTRSFDELATLDWHALGERLTRDGSVVIAEMIDASTCERIRGMFDDDARFAKTVSMDRPEFGHGVYRYFAAPLPGLVDRLRQAVYPHVARIANHWQELLGESGRFPTAWDDFREECERAGQATPTPILLKYGPGGFNALHRDLRGAVFFPIQMAVVLSAKMAAMEGATGHGAIDMVACGFQGGDFLFCDDPEGKSSRRQQLALGLGDAVLFCTRDRLVRVGSVFGLQPVRHGVTQITAGVRFVLGVPFHEYR